MKQVREREGGDHLLSHSRALFYAVSIHIPLRNKTRNSEDSVIALVRETRSRLAP